MTLEQAALIAQIAGFVETAAAMMTDVPPIDLWDQLQAIE